MASFAVLVSPATGKPDYLAEFNQKYSTSGTRLDGCATCHTTQQDAQHLNTYGADLAKRDHDYGALEPLDSDGDGVSTIDEIKAGAFPGDPEDYPGHPRPKPQPSTTTTTTRPFPFSLLPEDLSHAGN
jgi:hypothetical protein